MIIGSVHGRHALAERGNDLYQSPPEAVRALVRHEILPARIWEPACGPGLIVRILRAAGHNVLATDLVDYASPDQDHSGVDFLIPGLAETFNDGRSAIVTNPPYKVADAFVARALGLVPYCAMLLPLRYLAGVGRTPIIEQSGLARVLIFRERLPMMHRDGWQGKKSTSNVDYAWFVWQRGHNAEPVIRRISWRGLD